MHIGFILTTGVILAASPCLETRAQTVVKGPLVFQEKTYALVGPFDSWPAAEQYAVEAFGGHLAAVTSGQMNEWLLQNFVLGTPGAWLGGTDAESEGNWRWTSGALFAYTNWRGSSREPNGGTSENYLGFFENGEWNDFAGDTAFAIMEVNCVQSGEGPEREWKGSPVTSVNAQGTDGLIGPFIRSDSPNRAYFLTQEKMSWTNASELARAAGGTLATVRNQGENQWLWETFWPLVGNDDSGFWIGLKDAGQEGIWRWESGEALTFTNWWLGDTSCGINEPNNCSGAENYAHMHVKSGFGSPQPGTWNDVWNEFPLCAVIEVPCATLAESPQRAWSSLLSLSGAWSNSSNWKDGIVPGEYDTARFNLAQSVGVTVNQNRALQLRIDRAPVEMYPPGEPYVTPAISFTTPTGALCVANQSLRMVGTAESPAVLALRDVQAAFDRDAVVGEGAGAVASIDIDAQSELWLWRFCTLRLADGFGARGDLFVTGLVQGNSKIVVGDTGLGSIHFPPDPTGARRIEADSLVLGRTPGGEGSILNTGEIELLGLLTVADRGKGTFRVGPDSQITALKLHVGAGIDGDGSFVSDEPSGGTLFRGGTEFPGASDFMILGGLGKGLLEIGGPFTFEKDGVDHSFGVMTIGGGDDFHAGDGTLTIRAGSAFLGNEFRAPGLRLQCATTIDSRARVTISDSVATVWSLETGPGDAEIIVQPGGELRATGSSQIGDALGYRLAIDVGNPEENARLVVAGGVVKTDGIRVGGRHRSAFGGNAALLVRGDGELIANYLAPGNPYAGGQQLIVAGGSDIHPARAECRENGRIAARRIFVGYDQSATPQSGELLIDGPSARLDVDESIQVGFRFPQPTELQNSMILFGGAKAVCRQFIKGHNASIIGNSGISAPCRITITKSLSRSPSQQSEVEADIECEAFEFFGDGFPGAYEFDQQPSGIITGEGPFPSHLPFVNKGILSPIVQPPDTNQNTEYTIDFASNFSQASTGVLHLDYYFNNNDSFDFSRGAITVTGTATLDGTLHLNYAGFCCGWSGPEMYIGQRVAAVRAQSVLGRFDNVEVAPSFRGVRARVEYTPTAAEIVFLPPCSGDLNGDDQVDDADFQNFLLGYNILDCADAAMPSGCPADLNRDGVVDDADFPVFVVAYDELLCP